ncbi:isochorismatase family protein [Methanosarcina sp. WH1]|uniref:isochorismatase family protein n=1 Tax=Methanosarcina sp. WH1 TaxID=1434102 RepID=UPI00064F7504|nr:isochorismatase family protein [Methanosarcina sp. WH1]
MKKADVTEPVICGAMGHMCINTTVRAVKELGFVCTVISDACATRDLKFKNGPVLPIPSMRHLRHL